MEINKVELIGWFWEKFNSCYLVKHDDYPESVFMYYDPQYIRKLKLANISGEKISKSDITGICLFEQDWNNKKFYCDYTEIWSYLKSNYSIKYDEIQQFISDRLSEHSKLSVLTPISKTKKEYYKLSEHSKLSVLTPALSVLTPSNIGAWRTALLSEHSKLSVLTPLIKPMEYTRLSVLTPQRGVTKK